MVEVKIFGVLRRYSKNVKLSVNDGIKTGALKKRLAAGKLNCKYIKVMLAGQYLGDDYELSGCSVSVFYIGGGGYPGG